MFPGAGFYGIRQILLSYAGLPQGLPCPVAVQHGWQRVATSFEVVAYPPEIWVWSERIASEYEKFYPKSHIRVAGSFFYYFLRQQQYDFRSVEKRGSICIPPHSSHFLKTKYSVQEFASKLDSMGDEYKPITVMLYYLDMDEEVVSTYQKHGFDVVSNGSMFNRDFLEKFFENAFDKKYCLFSEFGSGVFYSSVLGLVPVRIDVDSVLVNMGEKHATEEMLSSMGAFDDRFMASFSSNLVAQEMGLDFVMSPLEMRSALLKNYITWRFGVKAARRVGGKVLRMAGLLRTV